MGPVSSSSYVAPVVDLIASLTETSDEPGILAVTLAHLGACRPDAAELVLVARDADGRPHSPRVAVTWQDGHVLKDSHELAAPDLPRRPVGRPGHPTPERHAGRGPPPAAQRRPWRLARRPAPHLVRRAQLHRRIYQSLARQAALLLEHSLLADRQRDLLHDSLQQRQLLQTVLDHVPVGILMLAAPSSRPVLVNPAATRLLSTEVYNQTAPPASPAPYTLVYPGTDRAIPADQLVGIRAAATGEMLTESVDVLHMGRDRVRLEVTAVPMRAPVGVVEGEPGGPIKDVLLVLADVTARKRAEEERLRLQDEVIRVQAAALAERSSPIIPISDDILVLPIIGSIDEERGQQILTAILDGASQRRARVAILDITGVGTVDTRAAAALTTTARALRLLGVEPVLSGIRPDVAQTLINLGVGLAGITTCSTLQSSIQHALRRLGRTALA